jgi:hypothetical protein
MAYYWGSLEEHQLGNGFIADFVRQSMQQVDWDDVADSIMGCIDAIAD